MFIGLSVACHAIGDYVCGNFKRWLSGFNSGSSGWGKLIKLICRFSLELASGEISEFQYFFAICLNLLLKCSSVPELN